MMDKDVLELPHGSRAVVDMSKQFECEVTAGTNMCGADAMDALHGAGPDAKVSEGNL